MSGVDFFFFGYSCRFFVTTYRIFISQTHLYKSTHICFNAMHI